MIYLNYLFKNLTRSTPTDNELGHFITNIYYRKYCRYVPIYKVYS